MDDETKARNLDSLTLFVSLVHDDQKRQVKVFRDWRAAHRHIRDHILTEPETLGWHELSDAFEELVPVLPNDPNHTYHRWAEGESNPDSWWGDLYRAYANQIAVAMQQAEKNDWVSAFEDEQVGLSLCGVYWVTGVGKGVPEVRTAYLPSTGGTIPGEEENIRHQQEKISDRQRDYRKAIFSSSVADQTFAKFQSTLLQAEKRKWNARERTYYLLFRPAVQWIRKRKASGQNRNFTVLHAKLGSLKGLDFTSWNERMNAENGFSVEVTYDFQR